MTPPLTIPPGVIAGDLHCVVSISGGKDSTAAALALREHGIQFTAVFADTGWEADATYEHLEHLRKVLGPHPQATFFQGRQVTARQNGKRTFALQTIDQVVAWSRTERGGKLPLLEPPQPDGGCFRWGLCEPPVPEEP